MSDADDCNGSAMVPEKADERRIDQLRQKMALLPQEDIKRLSRMIGYIIFKRLAIPAVFAFLYLKTNRLYEVLDAIL